MKQGLLLFLFLVFLFSQSEKLDAGVPELYGFGAKGISMAQAGSSKIRDFSAIYYNPAMLTFAKPGISFGYTVSFDKILISLKQKNKSANISEKIYYAEPKDETKKIFSVATADLPQPRSDTKDIPNSNGFWIGMVQDLGLKNFKLAEAIYLPSSNLQSNQTYFVDEKEQFFSNKLHYGLLFSGTSNLEILVGAGYRPVKSISIGASLNFSQSAYTSSSVFIPDAAKPENVYMNLKMDVSSDLSYILGITFELSRHIRASVVYHGAKKYDISNKNLIKYRKSNQGSDKSDMVQEITLHAFYIPSFFTLSVDFHKENLSISADIVYFNWDAYRSHHDQAPDPKFSNTTSFRSGISWKFYKDMELNLGASYEADPVPTQTGRTNYVFNPRMVYGVGFSVPLKLFKKQIFFNAFAQIQALLEKENIKSEDAKNPVIDEFPESIDPQTGAVIKDSIGLQSNNPGYPGFTSGGYIGLFGVLITYNFK